jgi:hypothetical protein
MHKRALPIKYYVRRLIIGSIVMLLTMATFSIGQPASAAGNYYFYNFTGATGATCTGTPKALIINTGTMVRVANLPAGYIDATVHTSSSAGIEGPLSGNTKFDAIPPTSGIAAASVQIDAVPGPVTISMTVTIRQDNFKPTLNFNGTPITSTITITCTKPGAAPMISVQSNSPTGPYFVASTPYVPSSFVMRRITCTTAVYNLPGGTQVGSNQISSGQSWFVSPTAINDSNGKQWTPVFVGGWDFGYIPTSCAFQNQAVSSGPLPAAPARIAYPAPSGGPDFVCPYV